MRHIRSTVEQIEKYVASFISFRIKFLTFFQEVKLTGFVYSEKGMLTYVFSILEYQKDVRS